MKTQDKNSIYMILGALAVGIISFFMFGILVAIILAIMTAGGLYIYAKPEANSKEDIVETEESKVESTLDALFDVNLLIRENGLSESIMGKTEAIIDLLNKVIPTLEERYPSSQLRFTIDRMPTEYLPKLLNPYIQLEKEAQQDAEKKVLETLDAMLSEVQEVQDMIDSHKQKDFDQKAAFMAHRFSENY